MLEGLEQVEWSSYRACVDAISVPTQIRALTSQDAEQRTRALRALYGNIYYQGDRFTATPHALVFLMELVQSDHVSDRASILTLVTRLVAGDWTVRNGQTINDGERVLFFGRSVPTDVPPENLLVWKACYDAAAPFVPQVTVLLDAEDPALRQSAAWFLGCFRPLAANIAPPLLQRVATERYIDIKATCLFALHALHGAHFDAVSELSSLMARSQGWDWFMAGLCLADLQRDHVTDDVLGCLDLGLRWAIDGAADFYASCPFGDDLAGDIGHTLRRLPHERVKRFVSSLIARLRQPVSGLASLGLTEGLLQAALVAPLSEALRDRERVALAALFYCDEVWMVINNQSAFLARNLPPSREALGALLGLELSDREKGAAAFEAAVARTHEVGLADALPLFEESLRLRPDMPRAWSHTASALREAGRSADAIRLFRRALDVFDDTKSLYEELTLTLMLDDEPEAAIEVASSWLERAPDALILYNRACAYTRLGRAELALADLTQCVALDPSFYEQLTSDEDLEPLRGRPEFQLLLAGRSDEG